MRKSISKQTSEKDNCVFQRRIQRISKNKEAGQTWYWTTATYNHTDTWIVAFCDTACKVQWFTAVRFVTEAGARCGDLWHRDTSWCIFWNARSLSSTALDEKDDLQPLFLLPVCWWCWSSITCQILPSSTPNFVMSVRTVHFLPCTRLYQSCVRTKEPISR